MSKKKDRREKYEGLCAELKGLKFKSIIEINFKPHPFVVGSKHLAYASDNCGGMLGEEVMEKIPCAECRRPLEEHTYDTVLALELKKNLTNQEAKDQLKILVDAGMEADGIQGFIFVETEGGYRIS